MIYIIAIYTVLIFFSIFFLKGMPYKVTDYSSQYLSKDRIAAMNTGAESAEVSDLLIYQKSRPDSVASLEQFREILKEMKVGAEEEELSEADFDDLGSYSRVLLDLPSLSAADSYFDRIRDYVMDGGQLLIWCPPDYTESSEEWESLLGISKLNASGVHTESFYPFADFMLGGNQTYRVRSDGASAVNASLTDDCRVYAKDQIGEMPIVWDHAVGTGRVVVCNYPDCTKLTRGIFSSAYSLLGDVSAWPVINSQTFFLDDFPAPMINNVNVEKISSGNILYQNFISDEWWPDIHELGQKYNLPFTAMLIETYDIPQNGQIKRNTDLSGFTYYGRAITYDGGEIGIHGYNHQPLAGPDFQYTEDYGYKTWNSYSEMFQALSEAESFIEEIYPGSNPSVYVPPSNVLPPEGRQMIGTVFPDIHAIASVYLDGGDAYDQEFRVSEDGIVETPRITSGEIVNGQSLLLACSELNFHYVNTHFIHPDDVMEKERSNGQKWIFLKGRLDQYLNYIESSAPDIRHLTGSGLAGAVERFYYVRPEMQVSDSEISIHLDNHTDAEYLMVRINNGKKPDQVSGGSIQELTDSLYLVTCNEDQVEISLE